MAFLGSTLRGLSSAGVSALKYTLNKHVIGGARIERLRSTDLAVFQPVDAYQLSRTGVAVEKLTREKSAEISSR
jgi:hypothetical protein